jgi:putative spermidine/putrescine transport system permease protein
MLHRSIYHDGFSANAPAVSAWFAANPAGTEPDEAAFAALAEDLQGHAGQQAQRARPGRG